jgi:hypothetical protein
MQFRPFQNELEYEANRNSPQYIEARRSAVSTALTECARINTEIARLEDEGGHDNLVESLLSQKVALRTRVHRLLQDIPEDRPMNYRECD